MHVSAVSVICNGLYKVRQHDLLILFYLPFKSANYAAAPCISVLFIRYKFMYILSVFL
jgi:hypothetical protein